MVTGLATGPASAEPSGLGDPGAAVARLARLRLTGLPLPDRSAGVVAPTPEVTVRPGDSLWAIAERWLPPDARTHDVAVATHALYRRNAARIGTDPDLILPGTQLRLPRLGTDQGKDQ
jgi:Tfp pilus assembly protein FimV